MSNGTFDFNVFLNESKETLLNPKSYFTTMKTDGGMVEPLIKAVIYGGVAGLIYMIWGFLKIGASGFGMLGGAVGIMALISMLIGAVVGLFIGAVIMLVISAICKGNTDYEANLRVTASVMVIMPVSALLSFTMGINLTLGIIKHTCFTLCALDYVSRTNCRAERRGEYSKNSSHSAGCNNGSFQHYINISIA